MNLISVLPKRNSIEKDNKQTKVNQKHDKTNSTTTIDWIKCLK